MNNLDLLPCPFCGGAPVRTSYRLKDDKQDNRAIECMDCESSTTTFENYGDAQKAWNRRTLPKDVYTIRIPEEIIKEWETPLDD